MELSNFTLHLADLPSDFPFLDVLSGNYIPKFWEEILFEAVLLKFENFGSVHARDEARTTNTPKKWDLKFGCKSCSRARLGICTPTWLKLGFQLTQVETQAALQVAPNLAYREPPYLQRFSKVMGIDQIFRASSQRGNGLFERQFGCFNRGFHKFKGQDRLYRVYLVYTNFFVILSVILVPLVKKAVFVAIYGFVVEIALTKPTFPFRKALKPHCCSVLSH